MEGHEYRGVWLSPIGLKLLASAVAELYGVEIHPLELADGADIEQGALVANLYKKFRQCGVSRGEVDTAIAYIERLYGESPIVCTR